MDPRILMLMLAAAGSVSAAPRLALVGAYAAGAETTEIVTVHAASRRAFVMSSADGFVDVLSLTDPRRPRRERRIRIDLASGDDLTSVTVHPGGEYLLVAVERAEPLRGRVEMRRVSDGSLLGEVEVGVGPDAVAVSPDGRWALVCDEAEAYFRDPQRRTFHSAPGTLTILDLGAGPGAVTARTLNLPVLAGIVGVTDGSARRRLERVVDLDGDGEEAERIDLDGDGDTEDEGVAIGTLDGQAVEGDEGDGEELSLPLVSTTPAHLEPEYAVFDSPTTAWVGLQENNALLHVDVAGGRIMRAVGLGTTTHAADLTDDDTADLSASLTAAREPDGLALTPDGRYLLTADEGDTDPKASKTKPGRVAGGGRTLSVFDARDGSFVADTGDGLDRAAIAAGTYPDARSPNKGSEPEMVTSFTWSGRTLAAVSLERANAVALVDLTDARQPQVTAVTPIDRSAKAGKVAPEGIAHYAQGGQVFVYTADEKRGTVSVFEMVGQ